MASNFVQLIDDLGYAKTFYPSSRITRFINSIASKIYIKIYQNRKEESNRLVKFWKEEVPLAIAKHYRILLFTTFIFLLFYILGFFSASYDPELASGILGADYIQMTEKNIADGNPFGVYQTGNAFLTWLGIMINNVVVVLIAFVKGIVLGIFSLNALIENAMMVGVFHQMFAAKGLGFEFILAVMLHGTLELTAIVVGCAAGVIMGTSYIFPGTSSRLEAFKSGTKDAVKIIVGLVPIFGIAAFFEGFITGFYKMPLALNLFLLSLSALFVIWYFIIHPFRLSKKLKANTAALVHA